MAGENVPPQAIVPPNLSPPRTAASLDKGKEPSTPSPPMTAARPNSSPVDVSSVPIPPTILSGWTHRGSPSPRRVATATRLGAIDENGASVAPDIPQRSHQRQIAKVLNFHFTPTLHASRNPPAYTEYSDVKGPNGEFLSEIRRNRAQPRRGGWCRLLFFLLIPIAILTALGVGLGVGLTRKKSSNNNATVKFNNTAPVNHFPEGSYSFTTFLDTVSSACTPNPNTWRCYPYQTYNESTTNSQTVFNWVISAASATSNSTYSIASSDNPFALTFPATNMTVVDKGTESEAWTFVTPMQKIVVPAIPLTADGSTVNCYYNNTSFEAKLYTKRAKTYPPGAPSGDGSGTTKLYGEWPYAVEAQEVITAGSGVPTCYKVANGVLGEKVDIGTVSGNGQCECVYQNYGT